MIVISFTVPEKAPSRTVEGLQQAVDTWEGGLKVTGGALGPEKSYWYLVSFKWYGGRWIYAPAADTPSILYMNDINEVRKAVRRIDSHQAEETLGVWIAPNGNTNVQCNKMKEKTQLWEDHMRTGSIRKHETWLAHTSTIWRTLCYPLNSTNLTKEQCQQIMAPVINYSLPAMGVCRNYPRDLVFSSTKYCGIGIKHIYTLQEIVRIKDILHLTYLQTTTGKLYRTSFEYLILELGMGTDLSSIDYDKYKLLASSGLVKSTWRFLFEHNITLNHDIIVPKNTVSDIPLMPELCRLNPSPLELEEINQCRLYLQAFYVSDIASASGHQLSPHAWDGRRNDLGNTSLCNWPIQGLPGRNAWNTWRKFLKGSILARGMKLKMDLGPWITLDIETWIWYFAPTLDSVIQITNGKLFLQHPRHISKRNNDLFFSHGTPIGHLPNILLKATVQKARQNLLWLTDTGPFVRQDITPAYDSFHELLQDKDRRNPWCYQHVQIPLTYDSLLSDIQDGQVTLISDGSYMPHDNFATAAWMLEGKRSKLHVSGRIITPSQAICNQHTEVNWRAFLQLLPSLTLLLLSTTLILRLTFSVIAKKDWRRPSATDHYCYRMHVTNCFRPYTMNLKIR
jgi:hypothetical protein